MDILLLQADLEALGTCLKMPPYFWQASLIAVVYTIGKSIKYKLSLQVGSQFTKGSPKEKFYQGYLSHLSGTNSWKGYRTVNSVKEEGDVEHDF
ncbi:hypothetical protein QJS10_CPB21g01770 [Acorus calamus]|uniref:Uncharacterized protein n=1 Tax=Acorus calamus TaxID=4465 RepID=A0AAV9C7N1_ACOCL|nr:hypothetical protein QJS10_CPB21g01770 [Acorus calamus]